MEITRRAAWTALACLSESGNTPMVLTFYKPGVYNLFCRRLPQIMYTVVNVH